MTERAVLPPLGWIAPDRRLRVLVWHVHAAWLSAFVPGRHDYLIPRDASGGGKCGRDWPVVSIRVAGQRQRSTSAGVSCAV